MDTDRSKARRFVRWLKDKIENKRMRDGEHDPWWVTLLLDVGRPLVAVLILTMCAPGEHYLAVQAGWSDRLAWGMPGALTAYAGIAAVVATKRPAGAPGRKTAIWGAVLSILVAMAAQPLAHLYGRVWTPTAAERVWLTITVSCIPAAVFGHLLHMGAATPRARRTVKADKPKRTARADKMLAGADSGTVSKPQWLADNIKTASSVGQSVSELMSSPDSPPDTATWTDAAVSAGVLDRIPDTDTASVQPRPDVRNIRSGSMSADVREFLTDNPDATDGQLADAMSEKWPDKPWNSIYKARVRFEDKIRNERTA